MRLCVCVCVLIYPETFLYFYPHLISGSFQAAESLNSESRGTAIHKQKQGDRS